MIQLILYTVAVLFVMFGQSEEKNCDTANTARFFEVSGEIYDMINVSVSITANDSYICSNLMQNS